MTYNSQTFVAATTKTRLLPLPMVRSKSLPCRLGPKNTSTNDTAATTKKRQLTWANRRIRPRRPMLPLAPRRASRSTCRRLEQYTQQPFSSSKPFALETRFPTTVVNEVEQVPCDDETIDTASTATHPEEEDALWLWDDKEEEQVDFQYSEDEEEEDDNASLCGTLFVPEDGEK